MIRTRRWFMPIAIAASGKRSRMATAEAPRRLSAIPQDLQSRIAARGSEDSASWVGCAAAEVKPLNGSAVVAVAGNGT